MFGNTKKEKGKKETKQEEVLIKSENELEQDKKKKKRKKIVIRLAVVAAIIAAVVIGVPKLLAGAQTNINLSSTTYTDVKAEKQNLTVSLSGSGTLEPADSYTVTNLIKGEILASDFEEGSIVEKDTVLFRIDSSDAATSLEKAQLSLEQAKLSYNRKLETLDNLTIKADKDGVITDVKVDIGDTVQAGQTVATYRNSDTMEISIPFTADDAKNISIGQSANVVLDSSFETLYGTVTKVSQVDNVLAGNMVTRDITIAVKNPGALGKDQSATATIGSYACAASATFQYKAEGNITAKQGGEVKAINVTEGSKISKNQTVVTLKSDNVSDEIENARISLRNAELSLENQTDTLSNYSIKSPIKGTIINKNFKQGDTLSESGKQLCTIYDLTYLKMTLSVDELDIKNVEVGQKVEVTVDAVGEKKYEGTVTKVSVQGTTSGGVTSYPVTVRIDAIDGLLPGMNADIKIVVESKDNVLAIPSNAVNRGNLVLVKGTNLENKAETNLTAPEGYTYVKVSLGLSTDDYVEITDGLSEGDTVAVIRNKSGANQTASFAVTGQPMQGGGMGEPPADGPSSGGNSGQSGSKQQGGRP